MTNRQQTSIEGRLVVSKIDLSTRNDSDKVKYSNNLHDNTPGRGAYHTANDPTQKYMPIGGIRLA